MDLRIIHAKDVRRFTMISQFEHGETTSCEWCDGEEHCISRARWTRLLMSGKTITASGDENASVEINYCPNCGRRLRG